MEQKMNEICVVVEWVDTGKWDIMPEKWLGDPSYIRQGRPWRIIRILSDLEDYSEYWMERFLGELEA